MSNSKQTIIENQIKNSYLSYAMSVISSRAIPDVRDGLKPVQRRILYAMHESGMYYNKPHRKSSKVVGDVMANYHPHGDSAIYEALVRMARDFSMGHTLVNGQGNFGSIDNDPPAAMRYTEARLEKLAQTMLDDIKNQTVSFRETYDGTGKEPVVLPASFPNILINGSDGIAVGMATNIPSYNLGEVLECCKKMIHNPNMSMSEVQEIIPGPDFPTKGIITNSQVAKQAVATGKGSVKVRGRATIENIASKNKIIITEIPYQVVKTRLIEKISDLVKEKRLEGISAIRDESNKKGIRLIVELKRDASPEVVLNHLYKYTQLESSFAVNALVLNKNKPQVMNVKEMIQAFLEFKKSVIINRLSNNLNKLRSRAHTMIGLRVAVDSIDKIIAIIRNSETRESAKKDLLSQGWEVNEKICHLITLVSDFRNKIVNNRFSFTEDQVNAILDMKLSKLTGLERDKISVELKSLGEEITDILEKLKSEDKIKNIMHEELSFIQENFAVPRRTEIQDCDIGDIDDMDLIEKEDVLITLTANGYIKRVNLSEYSAQKRGGKGKTGVKTKEDDNVAEVIISNTHSYLLMFTEAGKVYRIRSHKIPASSNASKGRPVINFIPISKDDSIKTIMSIEYEDQSSMKENLIFATKKGKIRKSNLSDFHNINENGKIAIKLDKADQLIAVLPANENDQYLIATSYGKALRCELSAIRTIKSRNSSGVNGININESDEAISLCILSSSKFTNAQKLAYLTIPAKNRKDLLSLRYSKEIEKMQIHAKKISNKMTEDVQLSPEVITEMALQEEVLLSINSQGFGKRSSAYEYRITNRGGKGIANMDIAKGNVIQTFTVEDDDNIIMSSSAGKVIRCRASDIPIVGRNTKGVKVFKVDSGEQVLSVEKIPASVQKESGD